MEKVKKETFDKWVQKCNWLKVNEVSTTDGRQMTFLTPSGNLIIAILDIEGNLFQVALLGPPAPQNSPSFPPGFFKGGPFLGKG